MAVFRIEKTKDYTIMSNHHLRNKEMSLKAKGLLSLMLSLPEGWDYTTKGLAAICKEGVDAICSSLQELEDQGYLTRTRIRGEKGRLGDIEYTIHEQPISHENIENKPIPPKREKPVQVKPILEKPKQDKPRQENPAQSITKEIRTEIFNKDQSINPDAVDPDMQSRPESEINDLRQLIKRQIECDILRGQYGSARLDEIAELMLEVLCSQKKSIRIAGEPYPASVVKRRFLSLNSTHVIYVLDSIDKNTTKIRNIKAYLLTALYNAPATIESYYLAEVRHDLYGAK
jgi:hypothetical protein